MLDVSRARFILHQPHCRKRKSSERQENEAWAQMSVIGETELRWGRPDCGAFMGPPRRLGLCLPTERTWAWGAPALPLTGCHILLASV